MVLPPSAEYPAQEAESKVPEQPQEDPRLQGYSRSMATLTPKDREKAIKEGTERYTEMVKKEDLSLFDEGFLIFQSAPAEKQWTLFRDETDMEDVYRVLLNDDYLDQFEAGTQLPPVSRLWNTLLMVGGEHVYEYWRSKFLRLWNKFARDNGLTELVYERGRSNPQPPVPGLRDATQPQP